MSTLKSSYHHGDLRAVLIAKAHARLRESETAEISLRELARDIGVSAMAAYRHFSSKEALLAALADDGFRKLDAEADGKSAEPSARLLEGLLAYVEFAHANPGLYALMFGQLHAEGAALENRSASFVGLKRKVADIIGTDLADPETESAAARIWATVHGCASLVIGGLLGPERLRSGIVETILKPLCENPSCVRH